MAEEFAFGNIETANGQGPAGNEIPYWRVISGTQNWYWPSVGLSTTQSIDPTDYGYLVQGSTTGLEYFQVSSANPDTGTYHLRTVNLFDGDSAALNIGDQARTTTSALLPPVGFTIVEDATYTFSFRLARNYSTDSSFDEVNISIRTGPAGGGSVAFPYTSDIEPTGASGVYQSFSLEFTFTSGTYDATHTTFSPTLNFTWSDSGNPVTVDVDNISLVALTTLYWRNTGFRFPYPRWT